jgi:hypothetical protein
MDGGVRELVIWFSESGYQALSRLIPRRAVVCVLAIRRQCDLDYSVSLKPLERHVTSLDVAITSMPCIQEVGFASDT